MSLRRRLGRLYGGIRGGSTTLAVTARFRAALNRHGAVSMFSGTPCSRLESDDDYCSEENDRGGAGVPNRRRRL